jgi:hypothetical protein
VTKDAFPLPSFGAKLRELAADVSHGRGFQIMRGVPVERYSRDPVSTRCCCTNHVLLRALASTACNCSRYFDSSAADTTVCSWSSSGGASASTLDGCCPSTNLVTWSTTCTRSSAETVRWSQHQVACGSCRCISAVQAGCKVLNDFCGRLDTILHSPTRQSCSLSFVVCCHHRDQGPQESLTQHQHEAEFPQVHAEQSLL